MASKKILLTGATGYIGGSVLHELVEAGVTKKHQVSAFVRGEDRAKAIEKLGIKPILFESLDQSDVLQRAASQHDIVIHTATGFHTGSAKALILGLGDRKKNTGNSVHYIHTSGTSNLGDQPITGRYSESKTFSDRDDVYSYLKMREEKQPYAQRTTDLVTVETGKTMNVPTTIIMSPLIYGVGLGPYNKLSIQIPTVIRSGLKNKVVEVIGEGKAVWDYVHIADLTKLYLTVLLRVLGEQGGDVPTGEKGIIFSATGRFAWKELAQSAADALKTVGAIPSAEVKSISVDQGADRFSRGLVLNAELGFASNSRTSSDVSRSLGWKPVKTEQDFKKNFLEEAKIIFEEVKVDGPKH